MSIKPSLYFTLIECYYIDITKKGTTKGSKVNGNEKRKWKIRT